MSLPSGFFTGLLKTLAGQLFDQGKDNAGCIDKGFGTTVSESARQFFSVFVTEDDLPGDLAAVGVLVDNRSSTFRSTTYTFFIFIDSTKKYKNITDDLGRVLKKMVLSHEICHFVFYYELFFQLGDNLTSTVYTDFQSKVSGKLDNAVTQEADVTSQTVSDEHSYEELIKNFWSYPDSHYDKNHLTNHDYNASNKHFFRFLTKN